MTPRLRKYQAGLAPVVRFPNGEPLYVAPRLGLLRRAWRWLASLGRCGLCGRFTSVELRRFGFGCYERCCAKCR